MHRKKIKRPSESHCGRTLLIIRLPEAKLLRIVSRSLFLALAFVALPSIGFIAPSGRLTSSYFDLPPFGSHSDGFGLLRSLLRDLADEGLLKSGDRALVVSSSIGEDMVHNLNNGIAIDMVMNADYEHQNSIPDEMFDFSLALSFRGSDRVLVDRVTKVGGVMAMQLNAGKNLNAFQEMIPNYKIVYIRKFNSSTIVAMRKTGASAERLKLSSRMKRHLCEFGLEAKKQAIEGLEGVLLEPPRPFSLIDKRLKLKETKFLPDLLGISLNDYSRRVFVNVDMQAGIYGGMEWFRKYYPKGNQHFEVYDLRSETGEWEGRMVGSVSPIGISDWLRKEVREDQFIVMKAEAEVVEELMKEKTICLVDELFLECDNQWQQGGKEQRKRSRRAYWECVALYGRLRDEGVAVQQWWN